MKRANLVCAVIVGICLSCFSGVARAGVTMSNSYHQNCGTSVNISCNSGDIILVSAEVVSYPPSAPSLTGATFTQVASVQEYSGNLTLWKYKATSAISNQPIDVGGSGSYVVDIVSGGSGVDVYNTNSGRVNSSGNETLDVKLTTSADNSLVMGFCGVWCYQGWVPPWCGSGFTAAGNQNYGDYIAVQAEYESFANSGQVDVTFGIDNAYFFWEVIGISISPTS